MTEVILFKHTSSTRSSKNIMQIEQPSSELKRCTSQITAPERYENDEQRRIRKGRVDGRRDMPDKSGYYRDGRGANESTPGNKDRSPL